MPPSLHWGLWLLQKRSYQSVLLWCSPGHPSPQQVRVQGAPTLAFNPANKAGGAKLGPWGMRNQEAPP